MHAKKSFFDKTVSIIINSIMSTNKISIESPNLSAQLAVLNHFLSAAQTTVSFFGSRYVVVNDQKISLHYLSKKVLQAAQQRCKADDLTPAERVNGIEIVDKINRFYAITDQQISLSNLLTRIICWLREFSFIPYTTRFYMEQTADQHFRAFSETKFLHQFGGALDAMKNHPDSDGFFGPPSRRLAREDRIRALIDT